MPNKHKSESLKLFKQLFHLVEWINGATVAIRPLNADTVIALLFTLLDNPHLVVNARGNNVCRHILILQQLLSSHFVHTLRASALQAHCE